VSRRPKKKPAEDKQPMVLNQSALRELIMRVALDRSGGDKTLAINATIDVLVSMLAADAIEVATQRLQAEGSAELEEILSETWELLSEMIADVRTKVHVAFIEPTIRPEERPRWTS
jgi:hypothetical protein